MADYANNVAVIKTASPIKLGKLVKPIKLTQTPPEVGSKAQIVGFGGTKQVSFNLRKLNHSFK